MLLALRVREVAAFVGVQRQAQTALIRAEVVLSSPRHFRDFPSSLVCAPRHCTALTFIFAHLHKIRVLVEVDCLQCQLAQALATVGIRLRLGGDAAAALLGADAVLKVHGGGR